MNCRMKYKTFVICLFLFMGSRAVWGNTTPFTDVKIGTIASNETWSGKILLLGDVEIPAGVTVTVAPGTQFEIYPRDLTASGQNPADSEIIIDGNLNLEAIPTSPIQFSPLSEIPSEPMKLDNTSTRLIQFQPYQVDITSLRQDFRQFKSQYFVFWTILWGVQWLFR